MQCPVTVSQHPISKRWATPAAKHKKQSKLLSDVISSTATSSADKICEEKALFELHQYVDDSSCDSTVNPLRWWYENKP